MAFVSGLHKPTESDQERANTGVHECCNYGPKPNFVPLGDAWSPDNHNSKTTSSRVVQFKIKLNKARLPQTGFDSGHLPNDESIHLFPLLHHSHAELAARSTDKRLLSFPFFTRG